MSGGTAEHVYEHVYEHEHEHEHEYEQEHGYEHGARGLPGEAGTRPGRTPQGRRLS